MQLQINSKANELLESSELPDLLTVHDVSKILGIGRVSVNTTP